MKSTVIGFRLSPHHEEQLRVRAELAKVSPGEIARALVRAALDNDDTDLTNERLDEIEQRLEMLRANLAVGIKAVLVTHGNLPLADVDQWAAENLL